MNDNSILATIRKAVGLDIEDEAFDTELILHINSALATLRQVNVGKDLVVKDASGLWDDFMDTQVDNSLFEMVKLYVFAKVKLLFDPPPPSNVAYYKESIDESLWRLKIAYDKSMEGGEDLDGQSFYRRSTTPRS